MMEEKRLALHRLTGELPHAHFQYINIFFCEPVNFSISCCPLGTVWNTIAILCPLLYDAINLKLRNKNRENCLSHKNLIKSNVTEVCVAFSKRDTVRVALRKSPYQDRSTPDSELNDESKRRPISQAELFFVNAKSLTLPGSFSVFSSFFVGALLKRLSRWTIIHPNLRISKWQMRQKMHLRVVTIKN